MPSNKHLIVLVGPTAIGKTSISIQIANHYNTEIISADSRQFYKEMSIGTAKPTIEEREAAPHHFVDFLSIRDEYNAGQFEREAIEKIEALFEKHDVLIVAGGSGLYVNAICYGLDDLPKDLKVREKLNLRLEEEGIEKLQNELQILDPEHYQSMDIHNPQRLIRALEVCQIAGIPYSTLRKEKPVERNFLIHKIGLTAPREVIYERINQRVDQMIENGLIEEVKSLIPFKDLNALNTVGYKELFSHFTYPEALSLEEAIANIKMNTRRFAKRQLTWFKKDQKTKWFDSDKTENVLNYLKENIPY